MKLIATSERGDQLIIPVDVYLEKGTLRFRPMVTAEATKYVCQSTLEDLFEAKHGYRPEILSFSWGGE